MTPEPSEPLFIEHRDVTVKFDSFTIGALCLLAAAVVWIVTKVEGRER